MAKPKAVDLVARRGNQKLAFEIETGKNSLDQIVENLSKGLAAGCERVYLVPTNKIALKRIYILLYKMPYGVKRRIRWRELNKIIGNNNADAKMRFNHKFTWGYIVTLKGAT